ncbi:protein pygopus isoform X2 [Folsomia candida]|uniref:protein pygopus isoform X2 n=1 Tax=Folsomia candida TaxID=158441 RepID=UPI000B9066DB|nr:protein pygopus isoform X2 [Folsomia candida]
MKMKSRGGNGDFKSPAPDSPTAKKKRRTSTAPSTLPCNPAMQSSPMPEMIPPAPLGYGDTIIASNPFDDMPSQSHPSGGPPMGMGPRGPPPGGFHPGGPPMQHGPQGGPQGGGGMGPGPGGMGSGPPGMGGPQGMMRMSCPPGQGGPPNMGPGGQMPPNWNGPSKPPIQSGKMYPPDQPMIFNPQNPNAPPIYPCGLCHREVHDNDQAIPCESGCHFWYHRVCTGLTEAAFYYLNHEVYAEWVCDTCLSNKNIPLVKFKP